MILSSVDLPEPFRPSMPILAPGKKDREMSLRICRFGGTILPTRFMVKTYWAIGISFQESLRCNSPLSAGWALGSRTTHTPRWIAGQARDDRQPPGRSDLPVEAVFQRRLGNLI